MSISKKLHKEVFDWLYEWSKKEQYGEDINPYFATRFRRDEKFKEGFYFQGNNNYLAITFWTGSDYINKTPNIYFEIHLKYGIRAWMIGRDSTLKMNFFNQLSQNMPNWSNGKKKGTFIKQFSNNTENYIYYLSEFINNDKRLIDLEIQSKLDKLDKEDDFLLEDEYSSKFGFISSNQFEIMITRVKEDTKRLERNEKLKNILEIKKEELKISLESISILNYHDIIDTSIENLPSNANWIFLTGMNGFGKTSVLQAIALGLTNYKGNTIHMDDKSSIKIGFLEGDKNEVNSSKMYFDQEFRSLNNFVSAYGPSRLLVSSKELGNEKISNESNIDSLFEPSSLKNIDYELGKAYTEEDKIKFKALKTLIIKATDGFISDIIVENGLKVLYKEKLNENEYTNFLPRIKLSAGYRSVIHLVGDILIRLFNKELHKTFEDIYGIVIIDEIENHLHPILQKKIPKLLSSVFPNIQFIVSTHSPIILLGATETSVLLNVQRTAKKGIKLQRLDQILPLKNLLPNAILESPLFDLDNIVPNDKNIKELLVQDDFEEALYSYLLKKRFNNFQTTKND